MSDINWYIRYHQLRYWTFFKKLEIIETLNRLRARWLDLFAYDIIISFDEEETERIMSELNGDQD